MKIPVTLGDVMYVYGSFGLNLDYTVRLFLQLKDTIDSKILSEALVKTQQRYPYLSLRLRKDEKEYYYEENPAPVTLHHTDEKIRLNAEETNYHIWAVCYNEDRLYLDIYHGALDGTGMYKVLSTLLFYYCADRYGVSDHTGINTLEDPILPEESLDPSDAMPPIDPALLQNSVYDEAFSLIKDGGSKPSSQRITDIKIPEAAFVKFSSAHDASPGTMVCILMSRTIDALYPERTKDLISSYVINARPMLNAPHTHHNCVQTVFFNYTDRIKAMPFDRQCTVHRGTTFIQSDADLIKMKMQAKANSMKMLLDRMPTIEMKKQTFAKMLSGGKLYFTYLVSYVGKWKFKQLEPYILEFWTHVPIANDLVTEIASISGNICLSIHQDFEGDSVANAFLEELKKNNIPYEVKKSALSDVSSFADAE